MANTLTLYKTTTVLCTIVVALFYSVVCKGSSAEDCLSMPTQTDMNLCSYDVAEKENMALEAVYNKLMEKINPDSQAKLREAQSAWIEYRKKQCEFNTRGTVSGSVHPMIVNYRYAGLAYEQTKTLRLQLECEEGDLSCVGQ